ncbi:winged helix-turn-helix domain-containing protein [Halomicrobium salinisoli]|uniref:winged helix-turn-helix domain-containing protein n=1 Tax=Halomicrobium salinisoli TaxID=2878391 RepID=UPI001CF05105|nr:winged helix-turn-helix domain-containing protein [Halomicrobium salinisoli]
MSRVDSLQECEDCVPPADAFSVVADETRLAILEALWQLETPARFTDVHDEVGLRDSAQFNYHLGKLTGQFVRKREEGYELRTAGERVVQAILAGSFTEHPRREFDLSDPCTKCGEPLAAEYEDETLAISCPACGHGHGEYPFPPGGFHERSDEEVLEAFDQRVRHLHCLAKDGVCPECNGRMETTISREGDCCLGARVRAEHVCRQCHHELCSAVGLALLDQSDVVAFCDEQGVALSETPYWRFEWCVDDEPVTVDSEDPWRLTVDVTVGGETLRVTVDGDLSVVDTERA